jgi:methylenetetrahydrofolate reductase (NADPH)
MASEAERRDAILASLAGASVELMPRDKAAVDHCIELVAPGTSVFISRVPGDAHGATVATAVLLREAGFDPVPHVAARYLENRAVLDDLVARLVGEAGVQQVLCIAGDVERPAGPFAGSLDLIATGILQKRGVRRVGIAGYPEGHPKIDDPSLAQALDAKLASLRDSETEAFIVTQFCFDAAPIVDFVGGLRARGIAVPILIGVAGPASIATLTKFAVRCGIGKSMRALIGGRGGMTRLLTDAGPEAVVDALAQARLEGTRLHFYTFGGVAKAGRWLNAVRAGAFTLTGDEAGFRLNR